jgi:hypothetical protein
VLIPSLDPVACVAEIVRRQLGRPFARPAGREEAVIRERFPIYVALRARKIETMRPPAAVVDDLVTRIDPCMPPDSRSWDGSSAGHGRIAQLLPAEGGVRIEQPLQHRHAAECNNAWGFAARHG